MDYDSTKNHLAGITGAKSSSAVMRVKPRSEIIIHYGEICYRDWLTGEIVELAKLDPYMKPAGYLPTIAYQLWSQNQ